MEEPAGQAADDLHWEGALELENLPIQEPAASGGHGDSIDNDKQKAPAALCTVDGMPQKRRRLHVARRNRIDATVGCRGT